jgi:hypothetical protein
MNCKLLVATAVATLALTAFPASAYTSYLAAREPWPTQGVVVVDGASTQTFYQPGVALPGALRIATPNGSPGVINNTEVDADVTHVGIALDAPGTYRISTGEVAGQLTPIWDFGNNTAGDPVVRPRHDGDATPDGATAATYQSVQSATTFVTYGSPTRAVVDNNSDHLTIHAITDPNQVVAASGIQFEILFNGAPVPNFSVVLYTTGDADANVAHFINTDATGKGAFTFTQPGRYTMAVRKLVRAPAGGQATVQMFTSTLTFDVMAAPHANVTIQSQAQRPRPRRDWLP